MAGRTNDAAGDGTTTASVLARELIHFGLQVRCRLPSQPIFCMQVIAPTFRIALLLCKSLQTKSTSRARNIESHEGLYDTNLTAAGCDIWVKPHHPEEGH